MIQFSTKPKSKQNRHEPGGYYWMEDPNELKNVTPRQRKIIRELRKNYKPQGTA